MTPSAANVLIVDDDPGTLQTFEYIARSAHFSVYVAETGLQAIRIATELNLNLALCDLNLPDLTGLEVLRRFRVTGVNAPFLIMTGFPSTDSAMEAGKLGVLDYLTKPVSEDELLCAIRTHASPSLDLTKTNRSNVRNHHVTAALQAIEQWHMRPDLSIGAVAGSLAISKEHLCRLLKQHTGQTFRTLLTRARVERSRHLLATTSLSIKEIANQAGFNDASHFDRCFKSALSVSPRSYRLRAYDVQIDPSMQRRR
jgi:YesN/AraC family two-component response regulator